MLVIALIALISLSLAEHRAEAQAWSLTKAKRQAYLSYYAPVILKRGDENNDKEGRDWLTNFDFDQDGNFSTNRVNWRNIDEYVAASAAHSTTSSYSRWRIRPTLYTALVEYMEGTSKSLALLYHVYNAADKDGSDIHDWERIEILIRNVSGTPGAGGEYVSSVTITLHSQHIMRRSYDSGLNFMQTTTGKHVLIWQADESDIDILVDACSTHAHELRFVANPYSWIASQISSSGQAEVNVNDKDEKKNVHYVFIPEGSSAAVSAWGAKPLNYTVASTLDSGVDNGDTVSWYRAKRITYELQDIADILPTHWQGSTWYKHWLSDTAVDVLLESPIINEAGQSEVSAGMQLFYAKSRDSGSSDLTDRRNGYPAKGWLFGAYSAELNRNCTAAAAGFPAYEGSGVDSYGRSRGAASGYYNSHGAYWWQHDFFAHSGVIDSSTSREGGTWLVGTWYTAANGGFDGRWVQLFDDRPGQEPIGGNSGGTNQPTVAITGPVLASFITATCATKTWSSTLSNCTTPVTYQWKYNGTNVGTSSSSYSRSVCYNHASFTLSLTGTCSNGSASDTHSVTVSYDPDPCGIDCNCGPGQFCP
ncbi:MAG TPA: hypothetical protein VEW48_26375 [Thermoanaerobaculia bacterium]|nr:hypothetical protein [Thermoanaerobaculia bacterium]